MNEIQKCRRCGKTFSKISQTGRSIGGMGEIMRHSEKKICPNCGGQVIWIDESGAPLSAFQRMEDMNRNLRLGCLWGIAVIIGFIILFIILKYIK